MRKNIFIVDDNIHVLISLEIFLQSDLWDLHRFSSMPIMTDFIEQTHMCPDLILTDYSLANGYTGIHVVDYVRNHFDKKIPALIISGVVSPKDIDRISDAGIKLIFKSNLPRELLPCVQDQLNRLSSPLRLVSSR